MYGLTRSSFTIKMFIKRSVYYSDMDHRYILSLLYFIYYGAYFHALVLFYGERLRCHERPSRILMHSDPSNLAESLTMVCFSLINVFFNLSCCNLATGEVFRQRNLRWGRRTTRRLVKHCTSHWRSLQGVKCFRNEHLVTDLVASLER